MSGAFDVTEADYSSADGSFKLMLDKIPIPETGDKYIFIDSLKMYKVNSGIKTGTGSTSHGYYIVNKLTGRYLTAEHNEYGVLSHISTREKYDVTSYPEEAYNQIWYVGKTNTGYYIEKTPGQDCLQITNPSDAYYSPGSNIGFGMKQSGFEEAQEFNINIAGDGICYRVCAQTTPEYFGIEVHSNFYDDCSQVRMGPSMLAFGSAPFNNDLWYFIPLDYDPNLAVIYATLNYDNCDNTTFPYFNQGDLKGDCANFVSQSIYIAGKPMQGDWYIKKLNNSYQKPLYPSQLNYSWELADPSPWISAKHFRLYWKERVAIQEYKVSELLDNPYLLDEAGFEIGDVITYCKRDGLDVIGVHTVIITGAQNVKVNNINKKMFTVSQHTSEALNKSLLDSLEAYYGSDVSDTWDKVLVYAMR